MGTNDKDPPLDSINHSAVSLGFMATQKIRNEVKQRLSAIVMQDMQDIITSVMEGIDVLVAVDPQEQGNVVGLTFTIKKGL